MNFFILLTTYLMAAPAPPHNTCKVMGDIISIEQRIVERDSSWVKAWGVDKKITYTDIELKLQSVKLITSEMAGECTLDFFEDKSFQLRPEDTNFNFSAGDCVRAKTQFSGDEFLAGQWIWDFQACE